MPQPEPGWLSPPTLVAIGSALIAIAAAYFSLLSANTARKALQLAREQDARRLPAIRAELLDAFVVISDAGRRYWIAVIIVNSSESPNSIIRAELILWNRSHSNSQESPTKLKIQANSSNAAPDRYSPLTTPYRLEGNTAASGALEFFVPHPILDNRHIMKIELSLQDALERAEVLPHIQPREVAR